MRLTLDANILVYALQVIEPRHPIARDVVARAIGGDCVLTLQSMAECYHVLVRKRHLAPGPAREKLEELGARFQVEPAALADLDRAMWAAQQHHLPFWDAMLWATARRAGCRLLISEDGQDGRSLEGVTFVNPFNVANGKVLNLALPPLEQD